MVESSELSLESEAKLAGLSVWLDEFFAKIDSLTNEVGALRQQVFALEGRIRLIELEHATD